MNSFIPQVIRERNEVAKKWIKENFVKLDKTVADVEEYVEQSQYYNYTSENFQEFRDKIGLYGEFYNILNDKGLKVHKTDLEQHNESLTEINKLQNAIQKVESS